MNKLIFVETEVILIFVDNIENGNRSKLDKLLRKS